ncbi:MAG: biotin transporter BioY [Alphaproteobacteria bacterium]|nr:biotin transporter BioY [Alphaproteobacteria bacterium]
MRLFGAIAIVVFGTLLLAASAHVRIPFIPVPATLQSLTIALIAAAFGARLGVATVMLYIVEGLSGLPVFTNGAGLAYVFSPTFGFILGWLPMAFIIGAAADRGLSRHMMLMLAIMIIGDAVSFGFGYAWLVALSGGASWIDEANVLGSAFDIAVKPFIVWDLLKLALAAVTVAGFWEFLRRRMG